MVGRCLILLLISYESIAQTHLGPRYQAMGNTGTALQGIYSLTANPAGLTGVERLTANIAYQHHFLNTDITTQTALLAIPTPLGAFGFLANRYGLKEAYDENRFGIVYAKPFGPRFSMAMAVNYHQLRVPNYVNNRTFSVDIGVQYQLESTTMGMYSTNVAGARYDHDAYGVIPSTLRLGISHRMDKVLVASDATYRFDGALDGHIGAEYSPREILHLRGGLSLNPLQQYAGFGVVWSSLVFDIAATFHPRLGTSPQIGICYVL